MHDDLIDAVDWAVAQGIADETRVGFFGGSYGAILPLTAATRTPECSPASSTCSAFPISHLHGDDTALLGAVVQRLEKPARRIPAPKPDRAFSPSARRSTTRTRDQADPDRAGHARCQGVAADPNRW